MGEHVIPSNFSVYQCPIRLYIYMYIYIIAIYVYSHVQQYVKSASLCRMLRVPE